MQTFNDYIIERRAVPYAVLVVGDHEPFRQVFVLYPNNKYKIRYEDNIFNNKLYTVIDTIKHKHYHTAREIADLKRKGIFKYVYAMTEKELYKYLKTNLIKGVGPIN